MAAGWHQRGVARRERPCHLFGRPVGNQGSRGKGTALEPFELTHQEESIDMAGIPKGSFSFNTGRRGRHRGGRWHGVVAYRISRAG